MTTTPDPSAIATGMLEAVRYADTGASLAAHILAPAIDSFGDDDRAIADFVCKVNGDILASFAVLLQRLRDRELDVDDLLDGVL